MKINKMNFSSDQQMKKYSKQSWAMVFKLIGFLLSNILDCQWLAIWHLKKSRTIFRHSIYSIGHHTPHSLYRQTTPHKRNTHVFVLFITNWNINKTISIEIRFQNEFFCNLSSAQAHRCRQTWMGAKSSGSHRIIIFSFERWKRCCGFYGTNTLLYQ